MTEGPHALAIDAAEWFADPAWRAHVTPRHWRRLPSRAVAAVRAALPLLAANGATATFFVPPELAQRAPELLREIVAQGHEVGLSALATAPLDEVPVAAREGMAAGWRAGRAALEAATGQRVFGFRAAWPFGAGPGWWRDALAEAGFEYDASEPADGVGHAVPAAAIAGAGKATVWTFVAWRLDAEQPHLAGLPRAVRRRHERAQQGARQALAALCRVAAIPIGRALGRASQAVPGSGPQSAPPTVVPAVAPPHPARAAGATPLTIVVPLKDEADGIAALFTELDQVAAALADVADCRFVVVDDGSTDTTWPLLQRFARERPRFLLERHPANRGVAAAIRTGLCASETDLVASIDGDLSYDPLELRAMLALAVATGADVVTASPYHPQGGVRNVPGWRLWLSKSLSWLYRRLTGQPIRTWTSCFRVYRRAFVAPLPLVHERFLGTAELLVRTLRRGGRVAEHPCVLEARLLGVSKMRVARTIGGHLRLLWQVATGVVR